MVHQRKQQESNIPDFNNRIHEVFYDEKVEANSEAIEAILNADIILIGIGSLFTSIIPCLIVDGICDAIKRSKAKRYYICNVMAQPGETDHFSVEDHVDALERHTFKGIAPEVIVTFNTAEDKLTEFDGYKGREIGYDLAKDQWGKGLMPEAVQAVINYMFNEIDLDFLLCGHFNKNNQSRRVQEKCGFKPYRSLVFNTKMGTKEPGVLNLLINPRKNIKFNFSHPETLIWEE